MSNITPVAKRKAGEPLGTFIYQGVRGSFMDLNEPVDSGQGNNNRRYGVNVILPKGSAIEAELYKSIEAEATQKWGDKAKLMLDGCKASGRIPYVDGDLKVTKKGEPYQGYAGNIVLSAYAQENKPPKLLNKDRQDVSRPTNLFYNGCYIAAKISIWIDLKHGAPRICASVSGVQFWADGESFGGGVPASTNDFEDSEIPTTDDFDV